MLWKGVMPSCTQRLAASRLQDNVKQEFCWRLQGVSKTIAGMQGSKRGYSPRFGWQHRSLTSSVRQCSCSGFGKAEKWNDERAYNDAALEVSHWHPLVEHLLQIRPALHLGCPIRLAIVVKVLHRE